MRQEALALVVATCQRRQTLTGQLGWSWCDDGDRREILEQQRKCDRYAIKALQASTRPARRRLQLAPTAREFAKAQALQDSCLTPACFVLLLDADGHPCSCADGGSGGILLADDMAMVGLLDWIRRRSPLGFSIERFAGTAVVGGGKSCEIIWSTRV